MSMKKTGAPATSNVSGVVTSNVDETKKPQIKQADPKKDKDED